MVFFFCKKGLRIWVINEKKFKLSSFILIIFPDAKLFLSQFGGFYCSFGTVDEVLNNKFLGSKRSPSVSGAMQGPTFTVFLFQMSFATTATTIVSGQKHRIRRILCFLREDTNKIFSFCF